MMLSTKAVDMSVGKPRLTAYFAWLQKGFNDMPRICALAVGVSKYLFFKEKTFELAIS